LDFIPVVSTIKTAVEFVAGQDLITGEAINRAESAAGLGASFIPGGKGAMKIAKMGAKMADKAFELNGKADAVIAVAGDIAEGDVGLGTLMNAASMRGGKGKGGGGGGGPRKVDKSWKSKVDGKAQKTGTPGHQFRTYREAIKEAKNPDVVSVHLDHGYNRALDLDPGTISPNLRPDVTSLYNDGRVKRVEVQSKTDVPAILRSRNSAVDQQLIKEGFTPTPPVVVQPTQKTP
jgi:hypothetical protein